MERLTLLIGFLLLLSSIIINGWYAITRGRWETNPDGSKYWTGKIFNKFHYFLQRHTIKIEYYKDNEFLKIFQILKDFFEKEDVTSVTESGFIVKKLSDDHFMRFSAFALSKGINVTVRGFGKDFSIVSAFKETKVYKLHYMLRDPLGECITCMASVYGILCFTVWYQLARFVDEYYPNQTTNLILSATWYQLGTVLIGFCVSIAFLNELLSNLKNKLSQ